MPLWDIVTKSSANRIHGAQWVEEQIKTGHFSNASDYVRDLIRRDQEYQDRREMLIKALIVGENSGESERSVEDIWRAVKARHGLDVKTFRGRCR